MENRAGLFSGLCSSALLVLKLKIRLPFGGLFYTFYLWVFKEAEIRKQINSYSCVIPSFIQRVLFFVCTLLTYHKTPLLNLLSILRGNHCLSTWSSSVVFPQSYPLNQLLLIYFCSIVSFNLIKLNSNGQQS